MPHTKPFGRASGRFGRHRRHAKDKARCAAGVAENASDSNLCPQPLLGSNLHEAKSHELPKTEPRRSYSARAAESRSKLAITETPLRSSTNLAASSIVPSYKSSLAGVQRASRSEPLAGGVRRSGGVPPLLCSQPGRGSVCGMQPQITKHARVQRVRHNPSFKRSANGRPPGPVYARYILHSPGLASYRRRPLNSNVRPHKRRPCAALP